jgi:hypothetical protein
MGWMVDMEQGTEGPCSAAHEPKKKGWHTASIFYLPAPLPAHADGCPSANHSLPPPEVSLPAVSQICYLILHNSVAKCLYFSSHVLLKEPRTYIVNSWTKHQSQSEEHKEETSYILMSITLEL